METVARNLTSIRICESNKKTGPILPWEESNPGVMKSKKKLLYLLLVKYLKFRRKLK